MPWFLARCHELTYDGISSFDTGSFAYSEGDTVEERATKWCLRKVDSSLGLPDLYYPEDLDHDIIRARDLESEPTIGYTVEPVDAPLQDAFVCTDFLVCTVPITIGELE